MNHDIKSFTVSPLLSDCDVKSLEGHFIDLKHYSHIVNYDCDVYIDDNMTSKIKGKRLLFSFRKHQLPSDLTSRTLTNLLPIARKSRTNKRYIASGKKNNSISSFIAGYYDQPIVKYKKIFPYPCRLTNFSKKYVHQWNEVLPLIDYIDKKYECILPDKYNVQKSCTMKIPEYTICNTIFTTLTVNYNWRTACHIDSGDFTNGYSVLTVCEQGCWSGCYLGYPKYGICVDVREGDLLIMDPHEYHCNTEFNLQSPDAVRLSLVLYAREGMFKCLGPLNR
jgi:hypothetical protein